MLQFFSYNIINLYKIQLGISMEQFTGIIANTQDLKNICFSIRKEVFSEEQKIPEELELDEIDNYAKHFLLKINNAYVGTARFYEEKQKIAHIGRVAILKKYRGNKYGEQIMKFVIDDL